MLQAIYIRYQEVKQFFAALVLSQCKHELFSIGMSSVQTEAISGEYYADEVPFKYFNLLSCEQKVTKFWGLNFFSIWVLL